LLYIFEHSGVLFRGSLTKRTIQYACSTLICLVLFNISVSPLRESIETADSYKTAWYILHTYRRLLFTVFRLFICNRDIVNFLTIRNIWLFSLRSPGLHQIEQRTLYCEHPVKLFRFPGSSITIPCTQMFTNYLYKSWTIKIRFPTPGYISGVEG
jgi:hypothetical protein